MYRILGLTVFLIIYGSLYPWHFASPEPGTNPFLMLLHSWPREWDRFTLRDSYINLELYFPLGAAALPALRRRIRRVAAVAATLCLVLGISLLVEMLQVYIPGRTCSLFDTLCNLAGALAGLIAMTAVRYTSRRLALDANPAAASALLLLACLAGNQFAPLFPIPSILRLQTELHLLLHPTELSTIGVWGWAAAWLVVAIAVEALAGQVRLRWLILILTLRIALRPFVVTAPLELDEVLGAALAMLLWRLLPETSRLHAALAMLVSTIVWRGLLPFHFVPAAPLSWLPFRDTFDAYRESAMVVLLRQTFEVGALVWLLRRAGISYTRAAAVTAIPLLALAYIERFLSGKMPSVTQPALVVITAFLLCLIERQYHPSTYRPLDTTLGTLKAAHS